MAESSSEGWRGMLDELDRQVVRAHRSLGVVTQPSGIWPMDEIRQSFGPLGTIPDELVPRAQRVLADYSEAIGRMQAARRVVGDHLDMLAVVGGDRVAKPVYFDRFG